MSENKDYRLMQIIENLKAAADETLNREKNDEVTGELIGYAEALIIIQEQLSEEEQKLYKLDFDVDGRYL